MALLLLLMGGFACGSLQQKADKYYASGEYQYAIDAYSKILETNPEDKDANLKVAEAYRLSNRVEKAVPYYEKLIEQEETFENYYRYAQGLQALGRREEAIEAFEKAKSMTLNDNNIKAATERITNLKAVAAITNYWEFVEIENFEALNTAGPDYAPLVSEGHFYFTSSRQSSSIYPAVGRPYTKLFRARAEGLRVDVNNIQALPEFRNEEGLDQASIAISPDGNTIIYARANSTSSKDLPETALFASYFRGGGFTQPIWMPVNEDEFWWNSTPAFSPDGNTLYFASNRPGGFGGIDLYKATRLANGDFGNAVNLGPEINTSGNELFPRISPDGKIYFSSDGHPGFGKLDLFVAEPKEEGGWMVKNLGDNMNSSADDFALFFTKYPTEGFFSSDREGGKGDDDIYIFRDNTPTPKVINVRLNVATKERLPDGTEQVLPNTRVVLYGPDNKMEDGDFSSERGTLRFTLTPGADFTLMASKGGYFSKSVPFSTVGKTPDPETLIQDVTTVTLDTMIVLEKLELDRAIVLENIYYDLDRAEIRPDAAEELDKLVQILKDNPAIRIELSSHTDDRASDSYNDDLSQRRAESAVAYIASQGIERERLVAKGYGKRQLLIQNARTEEEHQVNRRTEFKVIAIQE
ncbi:MAG: OmpA family protein [Nitritalea sp.]